MTSSRKKILVCILAAFVLLGGGVAALSVVPHAHGDDLDHSQHKSCAVHLYGIGHVQAASSEAPILIFSLLLLWLVSTETGLFSDHRFLSASSRAPPATF